MSKIQLFSQHLILKYQKTMFSPQHNIVMIFLLRNKCQNFLKIDRVDVLILYYIVSILTKADYFLLATIYNAYLPFVASLYMVDHLAFMKISSEDKEVRKLAAKSLGRLNVLIPIYFKNSLYESILKMARLQSLNYKHGALFTFGDLPIVQSRSITRNLEEKELKKQVFPKTSTKNDRQLAMVGKFITIFKSQQEQILQVDNTNLLSLEIIEEFMQIFKLLEGSLKERVENRLELLPTDRLNESLFLNYHSLQNNMLTF